MKTKYKILLVLLFTASVINAQSLNMRLSTYFYSYERADSLNSDLKTSHLTGYQNLLVTGNHATTAAPVAGGTFGNGARYFHKVFVPGGSDIVWFR